MRFMFAKFSGTCSVCGESIQRGTPIGYFGRGHVEHRGCVSEGNPGGSDEDEAAGFESGTLAADRSLARRGINVIRFNSGATMTQNSRGRCEDAPCCGCCS